MTKCLYNLFGKFISQQTLGLLSVAYRMLTLDKKKYAGMIIGSTIAAFIMILQLGIYEGIKYKMTGLITQKPQVDLWVMDKKTPYLETGTKFSKLDIYNVRSVNGVKWATMYSRTALNGVHNKTGHLYTFRIQLVDYDNLTVLPKKMISGNRQDIKRLNTIVLDGNNAAAQGIEQNQSEMKIGDVIEFMEKDITIAAITEPSLSLYSHPIAYMTFDTIENLTGSRNFLSFILVKAENGANLSKLANLIYEKTGYVAYTKSQFQSLSLKYFAKQTPLLVNFAILTFMGFIVGLLSIAELIYNLTLSNLNQFGILKLIGVSNALISKMIIYQGVIIGAFGYTLGICLIYFTKWFLLPNRISLFLYPLNFTLVFFAMIILILLAAYLSIRTVLKHDTVEICQKAA